MRHGWAGLIALGMVLSVSSASFAGEGEAGSKKETKADAKDRKDPEGIRGISPFMETINEGNAAYIARDYTTAVAKYQDAVQKKPNHPLGHYMLGQAFLADKKYSEANNAWQSALRFAEKFPALKAKTLFVLADLKEQQKQWDEAAAAWKAYAEYVGANPNANGYPTSPNERQKAIETRKDLETKYAKVKERIAQRERDAAEKVKK